MRRWSEAAGRAPADGTFFRSSHQRGSKKEPSLVFFPYFFKEIGCPGYRLPCRRKEIKNAPADKGEVASYAPRRYLGVLRITRTADECPGRVSIRKHLRVRHLKRCDDGRSGSLATARSCLPAVTPLPGEGGSVLEHFRKLFNVRPFAMGNHAAIPATDARPTGFTGAEAAGSPR